MAVGFHRRVVGGVPEAALDGLGVDAGWLRSLVVAQYHAAQSLEPRVERDRLRRALKIFVANYAEESARRRREAAAILERQAPR